VINIRSTLAAAALVFGTAMVASAQQPTQAPAQRAQQRTERAAGQRRGAFRPGALRHQLFKGIKLTDAEKANVKNVQQKYASQMKALREQLKPQMQAARQARQRGDTAALKAMWQKSGAERQQIKQLLESERTDLRAALTPEHQAQFDANVKQVEQRVAKRATRMWKKGGKTAAGQGPRG
jgi:Spy/CpxP family protein refolding chaperone